MFIPGLATSLALHIGAHREGVWSIPLSSWFACTSLCVKFTIRQQLRALFPFKSIISFVQSRPARLRTFKHSLWTFPAPQDTWVQSETSCTHPKPLSYDLAVTLDSIHSLQSLSLDPRPSFALKMSLLPIPFVPTVRMHFPLCQVYHPPAASGLFSLHQHHSLCPIAPHPTSYHQVFVVDVLFPSRRLNAV